MISIYSTPMPMEVLSSFHTGLIDGKQLTISDIIPVAGGFLAVILTHPAQARHWV